MALDPEIMRGAIGTVMYWLERGWTLAKALVALLEHRDYGHLTPSQRQRALRQGDQNYKALRAFQSGRALTVAGGYPAGAVPFGATVGVRVVIVGADPIRGGVESSVTMNVPSHWTMDQVLAAARKFYEDGGLRGRGQHTISFGRIADINVYQLVAGGLENPAIDVAGRG